ncbi:MAG TPA: hypothetical protein VIS05_01405 [Ilumatobacter sp.]
MTALVLLFAFTAGGVIWLSRDVNRRVANRSAAQAIAFQAARSGAQQVEVAALRTRGTAGDEPLVSIDAPRARAQAHRVAERLFTEFDVVGSVVTVVVDRSTVTVEIRISDPVGDVVGVGSARAEAGS